MLVVTLQRWRQEGDGDGDVNGGDWIVVQFQNAERY